MERSVSFRQDASAHPISIAIGSLVGNPICISSRNCRPRNVLGVSSWSHVSQVADQVFAAPLWFDTEGTDPSANHPTIADPVHPGRTHDSAGSPPDSTGSLVVGGASPSNGHDVLRWKWRTASAGALKSPSCRMSRAKACRGNWICCRGKWAGTLNASSWKRVGLNR